MQISISEISVSAPSVSAPSVFAMNATRLTFDIKRFFFKLDERSDNSSNYSKRTKIYKQYLPTSYWKRVTCWYTIKFECN